MTDEWTPHIGRPEEGMIQTPAAGELVDIPEDVVYIGVDYGKEPIFITFFGNGEQQIDRIAIMPPSAPATPPEKRPFLDMMVPDNALMERVFAQIDPEDAKALAASWGDRPQYEIRRGSDATLTPKGTNDSQ
jgi:hypothetical protein